MPLCTPLLSVLTAQSQNLHRSAKISPCSGLDRPQGFQEVETPRIFKQSAHKGGKVVRPAHWPSLPPREDFWYSFLLEAESTPGP